MKGVTKFVWNSDGVSNLWWKCNKCDFGTYGYWRALEHGMRVHSDKITPEFADAPKVMKWEMRV